MKKVKLIVLVVVTIFFFISCNKQERTINLDMQDREKKEELPIQTEDVNVYRKTKETSLENIEEKVKENPKWVYSFPEEYIKESTTDRYFSRKDWYDLSNGESDWDLNFSDFNNFNKRDKVKSVTIFEIKKDNTLRLIKKNDYKKGLLQHTRNEDGDAFSDAYLEYDEYGRLKCMYYVFDGETSYIPDDLNYHFSYSYDDKNSVLTCERIDADGSIRLYKETLGISNDDNVSFVLTAEIDDWQSVYERKYLGEDLIYYKKTDTKYSEKEYTFKYEENERTRERYSETKKLDVLKMTTEENNASISFFAIKDEDEKLEWFYEIDEFDEYGNWLQLNQGDKKIKREFEYY